MLREQRERERERASERGERGVLINRAVCCYEYKASKTDESELSVQHS